MSTILFHEIVYGPVHSRRMGSSLGVNLLPYDGKLCSFDCIYCECGFNKDFRTKTKLPDRENVRAAMEDKLQSLQKEGTKLDVITFAGNGEPTMHPE
ncbi:MAG: radical SAM protein, partial [Petrimonas sp.]|nr:radical SAM protein [Petrimonas sp.]